MTMSIDTLNFLRGITTILAMSAFVAVFLWAWSRRRREAPSSTRRPSGMPAAIIGSSTSSR